MAEPNKPPTLHGRAARDPGHSWGPWHRPGEYFSVPAYWHEHVQASIASKSRRVLISDCTLSEGEDMVGRHLSWTQRLDLALRIDDLGVYEIQDPIGVPFSELSAWIGSARRAGLKAKIAHKLAPVQLPIESDPMWKKRFDQHFALGADSVTLMTLYPVTSYWSDFTSGPLVLDKVIEDIQTVVSHAVKLGVEVMYSFPDSFRHRLGTMATLCKAGVDAGAYGVFLYDSRGQSNPLASREIAGTVRKAIGPDNRLLIQHHNDLGMATANALAAAEGGADMLDAAMCGVGDRSGTAALEEIACALYAYGWETGICLEKLLDAASVVERTFGFTSQVTKPIIGWQANVEEGWGHREQGDPPEMPSAIAHEILGRQYVSVIGPSVFGKDRYIEPGTALGTGLSGRKDVLLEFLDELDVDYTQDDAAEIERRTWDAIVAAPDGYIRLDQFVVIAKSVTEP